MTSLHSALTGSDLHEPKGVAAALSGEAYIADGAGSGSWTTPYVSATDTEARAKTLTTVGVSPGNLGALEYTSSNIALSTAPVYGTLSHGFSVKPSLVEAYLVCLISEHSYAVGEYINVSSQVQVSSVSSTLLRYICPARTKITLYPTNGATDVYTTSGLATFNPSSNYWALVVRARV